MSRAPAPRAGGLDLPPREAGHVAHHPLILRDGHGETIVLAAGSVHGDEITLLYGGCPVLLTIHLQTKT
jgi:hypothetical protein